MPLESGAYEIVVGKGAVTELGGLVPPGARRCAIVTQEGIGFEVDPGIESINVFIPDGETAKKMSVVEEVCRRLAQAGLRRSDVVVAVGGGVVTDVAGFAAAVYQRGISCINVATSLLGQVDAAIGGKTGVNIPEGKNLIGAFQQPRAVICDTNALATLSEPEMRSGYGEMAKYAFLGAVGLEDMAIDDAVASCAALKAEVVVADEHEISGRRALLNYGHTLGHALEGLSFELGPEASIKHGEAVAIGLVYAAKLAHRLGRVAEGRVEDHVKVVESYGLSARLPDWCEPRYFGKILGFMVGDKKSVFAGSSGLAFVLDGPLGVEVVGGVSEEEALATLELMGTERLAGA